MPPDGLVVEVAGLDEAGPALLALSVPVAANGDDMAVMEQLIEHRGCDDRIAEHGASIR